MDRTIVEFRGFTSCLDCPKEKGIIFGTGAWGKRNITNSKSMTQAYKLGLNV
jgi:hypothetical protein